MCFVRSLNCVNRGYKTNKNEDKSPKTLNDRLAYLYLLSFRENLCSFLSRKLIISTRLFFLKQMTLHYIFALSAAVHIYVRCDIFIFSLSYHDILKLKKFFACDMPLYFKQTISTILYEYLRKHFLCLQTVREARRQLHKNVASNIEQVLAATSHKLPTIRPPASHHENYPS